MNTPNEKLDARTLNCPLPILRTRRALSGMAPGQLLEVTATDPGSVKDMDAFCRQTGHELLSASQGEGEYVFLIKKA
ncbi:MAG: sulfurtransferase TusA family protein [Gammaproteobacteria bacterium]|nr:sulfurtransferase TusA family protein [Gammaproteobacteria bacterium]MDJ0873210.1 sulfurtransferase TusA family protein [Gammaproteobacteria bacterium]MDJ0891387.1 sulfurtransferase TusA family protein [Gammaproteobacteria bacterium]